MIIRLICLLFVSVILISSCKESSEKKRSSEVIRNDGKELSEIYCAACHQYPNPDLLNKVTWKNFMLPRMGYMYGIYNSPEEREALFEENEGGEIVRRSNLFPKDRRIDSLEWNAIVNHYLENAPDSLSLPPKKLISKSLKQFRTLIPSQKMQIPSTTMAQFSEDGTLYIGDAMTKSFSIFSKNLELLQTGNVKEGAVSIYNTNEAFWLTIMGSFSPTDAPLGMLAVLPKSNEVNASIPIKELQRPVHSSFGDLDKDGDIDIVICEFG